MYALNPITPRPLVATRSSHHALPLVLPYRGLPQFRQAECQFSASRGVTVGLAVVVAALGFCLSQFNFGAVPSPPRPTAPAPAPSPAPTPPPVLSSAPHIQANGFATLTIPDDGLVPVSRGVTPLIRMDAFDLLMDTQARPSESPYGGLLIIANRANETYQLEPLPLEEAYGGVAPAEDGHDRSYFKIAGPNRIRLLSNGLIPTVPYDYGTVLVTHADDGTYVTFNSPINGTQVTRIDREQFTTWNVG